MLTARRRSAECTTNSECDLSVSGYLLLANAFTNQPLNALLSPQILTLAVMPP
jgi:hypothetical protein